MEKPKLDNNGEMVMVVRPKNKKLALKIGRDARITRIFPSFDEMNAKCGPYTFEGYLSIKGEIIFDAGPGYFKVGKCKPGDSFISPNKDIKDENT